MVVPPCWHVFTYPLVDLIGITLMWKQASSSTVLPTNIRTYIIPLQTLDRRTLLPETWAVSEANNSVTSVTESFELDATTETGGDEEGDDTRMRHVVALFGGMVSEQLMCCVPFRLYCGVSKVATHMPHLLPMARCHV